MASFLVLVSDALQWEWAYYCCTAVTVGRKVVNRTKNLFVGNFGDSGLKQVKDSLD